MLETGFADLLPFLAVGLIGSGSECFGYDDDISQDHDFDPGFCIFLPDESIVDRRKAFQLERAYAGLPREYSGFRREIVSPVGGARRGVIRISEFFRNKTGSPDGILSTEQWLTIPEYCLAEATNGTVFFDAFGSVTEIRKRLAFYPEDIFGKKLAGHILLMAQAGQYNYPRCLDHGEPDGAQLAVIEFVSSAMSAIFLLNRRYQPFYKWRFRAFRELPVLGDRAAVFSFLLCSGNDKSICAEKRKLIESISAEVIDLLIERRLTRAVGSDLELHAYSVNDQIRDANLRNMHILSGV